MDVSYVQPSTKSYVDRELTRLHRENKRLADLEAKGSVQGVPTMEEPGYSLTPRVRTKNVKYEPLVQGYRTPESVPRFTAAVMSTWGSKSVSAGAVQ